MILRFKVSKIVNRPTPDIFLNPNIHLSVRLSPVLNVFWYGGLFCIFRTRGVFSNIRGIPVIGRSFRSCHEVIESLSGEKDDGIKKEN